MRPTTERDKIIDCRGAAADAGLVYTSPDDVGLSRLRRGRHFSYRDPEGRRVTDPKTLARIRALVIPPAWTDVWICRNPRGHVQAVGRDERGRRQYRYHSEFRTLRDDVKFEHMIAFAEVLPRLRHQVAEDMALPGLGRSKVLATVTRLLETTMIRVGNPAYAKDNGSYGLTTLRARHVKLGGGDLKFHFRGKSGKIWKLNIHDRRIAAIVKRCQDLPGQHLFQYIDEDGERQAVTSADVNAYLKEASGAEITAKDFRTWAGTVLAAVTLAELETADNAATARKKVTRAIELVSARLGNTPAICRKCYVHPKVLEAYLEGGLDLDLQSTIGDAEGGDPGRLRPEEAGVLAVLRAQNGHPEDRRSAA